MMARDAREVWRHASYSHDQQAQPGAVRIAMEPADIRPGMGFRQAAAPAVTPQPILLPPEAHVMTFAPTGAGKLVSCVAPALLQHTGPAIVLDPKGEVAAVTARRRREMGQTVHVIDPFGVSGLATSGFNPLDIVEPDSPDAADEAKVLANSLMPAMTEPKDVFWRSRAVHMLTAAILSAVSDYPPMRRNLSTVRNVMHGLARGASRSAAASGEPAPAITSRNPDVTRINDLMNLGAMETVGGIVHTALEGVGFVQGALVEDSLSASSFRLDDVTEGVPMTIYLVLPPHMMTSHAPMLRLWTSTLFSALMRRRTGPVQPTLLLLDEAAQLGCFAPLETAITLLRGYGVQTWSLWQDMAQLVQHYPTGYRTMLNNCRVLQLFGATSPRSRREAADMLGIDAEALADGDYRISLLLDGQPHLADRIDYRTDPELMALADPNPLHAPPSYPLRRRRPSAPAATAEAPVYPGSMAQISAALGRL